MCHVNFVLDTKIRSSKDLYKVSYNIFSTCIGWLTLRALALRQSESKSQMGMIEYVNTAA